MAIRAAVIFALCGLGLGIGMAMSQNHLLKGAHAHINLVGWVSLFLFRCITVPIRVWTRRVSPLCRWRHGSSAARSLTTGVTLIYGVGPQYEPIAAIGSLIVFASLLIFAVIVFRPAGAPSAMPGGAPAE